MFKKIAKYLLRQSPFILALAGAVKYAVDCKSAYDEELDRNMRQMFLPQSTLDKIQEEETELIVRRENGKLIHELIHVDPVKK